MRDILECTIGQKILSIKIPTSCLFRNWFEPGITWRLRCDTEQMPYIGTPGLAETFMVAGQDN